MIYEPPDEAISTDGTVKHIESGSFREGAYYLAR
jgi:hypothetical protein